MISSIKSLENCIQPFLDECDLDKNDSISEIEWGKCLDLSDSNFFDLEKKVITLKLYFNFSLI